MDWINLHTKVLDSPEVVGAEPVDRGTWLMLLRYCIGQENGGRIDDCADWKDRKWQQLARVTLAEVRRETDLWAWEGVALVVAFYPLEKQAEVQHLRSIGKLTTPAKQAAAKANGARGGRPTQNPTGNRTENPTQNPTGTEQETHAKPIERKGIGKEGKGKEGEAAAAAAKTNAQLAEMLCLTHPSKALTGPALAAALDAMKRFPFEDLLAGVAAYAQAVEGWTATERLQFVKNPEAFFREDIWRQPAENWRSRIQARQTNGQNVRPIDIGGRHPASVETAHLR